MERCKNCPVVPQGENCLILLDLLTSEEERIEQSDESGVTAVCKEGGKRKIHVSTKRAWVDQYDVVVNLIFGIHKPE